MLELEKLRTENIELQQALKSNMFSNPNDSDEADRFRREISLLESLVAELREELRNKRPMSAGNQDWDDEKIEFEVKLQKANARIDAMQNEMTSNAAGFAREMSKLKLIIAEKESLIETMSADIYRR